MLVCSSVNVSIKTTNFICSKYILFTHVYVILNLKHNLLINKLLLVKSQLKRLHAYNIRTASQSVSTVRSHKYLDSDTIFVVLPQEIS